jgi:glycerol-3-phosphate dehydrogenase
MEVAPGCRHRRRQAHHLPRDGEDAVDYAVTHLFGEGGAEAYPCVTTQIPLVGAAGFRGVQARRHLIAAERGWDEARVQHLLDRYGDEIDIILAMIDADPTLAAPLRTAPAYLRAEAAFAVTREGALHLEDILRKRIRLDYETRDRGASALPELAEIVAPLLGWDQARTAWEIDSYARPRRRRGRRGARALRRGGQRRPVGGPRPRADGRSRPGRHGRLTDLLGRSARPTCLTWSG